ncbi:hypothetical protein D8682_06740 [Buttiauxella sp. 3AFRM03]|uniref:OB-fold protein n=1 Tax=Buttiauxella sp. 3AFRM03 TaxID=2479367 RepID=UPI000EF7BBD7|nr:hypothetical protein [Buttiauxella sp. 3AFRM03]AYN26711.1 hypothetical protein D8682_06740 [Buttiauxella sp. 3AFRM03]
MKKRNFDLSFGLIVMFLLFISCTVEAEMFLSEGEIYVTPEQIFADYASNELAADEKYKGESLAIEGVVNAVKSGVNGKPYVVLKVAGFNKPYLQFVDTETDKLMNIKKGEKIAARCIGYGQVMGGPQLKECVLDTSS